MNKDLNYKALNIRVKQHHDDRAFQTQMIGLFKHNAYERGLTQAEFMALCMSKLYQDGFLDPIAVIEEPPTEAEINQQRLDELFREL